jgi:hypothetical protein
VVEGVAVVTSFAYVHDSVSTERCRIDTARRVECAVVGAVQNSSCETKRQTRTTSEIGCLTFFARIDLTVSTVGVAAIGAARVGTCIGIEWAIVALFSRIGVAVPAVGFDAAVIIVVGVFV